MNQQDQQKIPAVTVTCLAETRQSGQPEQGYADIPVTLVPSGRFITDNRHRKVAEMIQPGDSPAEAEAMKQRIVGSFNALPDLVGVLLRADKQGALWQALYNEGITDAYDESLSQAVKALGEDGLATVAHRFELDLAAIRAKADPDGGMNSGALEPPAIA